MTIRQPGCLNRGRASLRLAKIPIKQETAWYLVGNKNRLNVRIKCIPDTNTASLVNANVTRVLVDVEVVGLIADYQKTVRLRNCIRQFMTTGKSTCWNVGGGTNTPAGQFKRISWNDSLASMKIFGYKGQQYTFYCPPNGRFRPVWGTYTYTDNSSICTAAVHASRLSPSRGGNVRLQFSGGKNVFTGKKLTGVTSLSFRGQKRSFEFMNPPNGVNAGVITIFGRKWIEQEAGWNGVWTRQGYTNIFNAVWTKGRSTVKALLTIQINANKVTIDRRDIGSRARCEYNGLFSYDRKTVAGAYTCWNDGGVQYYKGNWNARIQR
jgi:hypothetical protein